MKAQDLYIHEEPPWIPPKILRPFAWFTVHVVARSSAELESAFHAATTRHFKRRAKQAGFVPDERSDPHSVWWWLIAMPVLSYLWLLNAWDAIRRRK